MKITKIEHPERGCVCIYFGKHGVEFPSIADAERWANSRLGEDVQKAILIRRALRISPTLDPASDAVGLDLAVNLEADSPVVITKGPK